MQAQDFALARQEVVLDVEPVHGLQMPAQNCDRDQVCDRGGFVFALLNLVQRLEAMLQILLVLGVPLRNARVEIPAVVIEARLGGELFYVSPRFLFKINKSHHHVGDLHARVVDVVLDIHFPARKAQQADERIAQDGVAEMPDVRGLVGINAGVLNENLALGNIGLGLFISKERGGHLGALDAGVDVSSAGNLKLLETVYRADASDNLFGDLAGRFAQLLGELEGERHGVLAELDLRRLLDHDLGNVELVAAAQKIADMLGKTALERTIQGIPLSC